jgi:transposase, IS30 family
MSYKHFSRDDRVPLAALLNAGLDQKTIAKQLNRHSSTISRELSRGAVKSVSGYYVIAAEKRKTAKRLKANYRFRKIENNEQLIRYVTEKLKLYWSPEQIAGRLKLEFGFTVLCHETIYQYIYKQCPELKKYLRCRKGRYRRRAGTEARLKRLEESKKTRIDKRPVIVEQRMRLGDWEGDTILGKEKVIKILTHVERRSGLLLADKLPKASAENVKAKAIERFKSISTEKKHTITYDNGSEFAEYELTGRHTGLSIYFAYPYHSWERGCNENANGLLRQFFPKGSKFANIKQQQIEAATELINHRPRKRHGYLTPTEIFTAADCTLD